ncbi:MAG: hypothetical protein WC613_01445 [Candidatus Aenigmatarchaeota archaeon]
MTGNADFAIDYTREEINRYGHSVLLLSHNPQNLSMAMRRLYQSFADGCDQVFSLTYSPDIDSPETFLSALASSMNIGIDDIKFNGKLDFERFKRVVRTIKKPILVVDRLDKLLFYGGRVHQRVDIASYLHTLESVLECTPSESYKKLREFHEVFHGIPNAFLRVLTSDRELCITGSAVKGTVEHDFVFNNSKSPIWCNLAEYDLDRDWASQD